MKGSNGILTPEKGKTTFIDRKKLIERYVAVRSFTHELCKPLVTEDYVVQTMPDVSPGKMAPCTRYLVLRNFCAERGKERLQRTEPDV